MDHIKQNASGLYLEIQKIGCFFRSALLLAEMKTEKNLTVNQINRLWVKARTYHYINEDLNVMDSAGIANLGLEELGWKYGKFREVATFKNGALGWYGGVEHRADFFIQKINQSGPSKYHFRVVDKYGNLIEDPHDPEIHSQGALYTICYQYNEV